MDKEEQFTTELWALYNKLEALNKEKMERALRGYTDSEVHCIEMIGKTVDPNVTKLAEKLYMTRGAISKMTKKLIKKETVRSYQKANNKKEVFFELTEKGQAVFATHEKLHQEFRKRDEVVFQSITPAEFDLMLQVIRRYSQHLDQEIEKKSN